MTTPKDIIHVLILENDAMNKAVIAQLLTEATEIIFELSFAHDPADVENFCHTIQPSILLINYDQINIEILSGLLKRYPELPIVLHTQSHEGELFHTMNDMGIADCLNRQHILRGPLLSRVLYYNVNRWKLMTELRQLALYDQLTGVMTRRLFMNNANEQLRQFKRYQTPFVLCICDLDKFKSINDTYGHLVGDQALNAFAQNLQITLRDSDLIGRLGGDEFVILLSQTDVNQAKMAIQRLLDSPACITYQNETITIKASYGLCPAIEKFTSISEMIAEADEKLYAVKSAGGSCLAICQ